MSNSKVTRLNPKIKSEDDLIIGALYNTFGGRGIFIATNALGWSDGKKVLTCVHATLLDLSYHVGQAIDFDGDTWFLLDPEFTVHLSNGELDTLGEEVE